MELFFTPSSCINDETLELTDQEARHFAQVFRKREGDSFWVTDGEGTLYTAQCVSIGKRTVEARISKRTFTGQTPPHTILAIGVLKKKDRLETAIEKAVELGVSGIILLNTQHTEKGGISEQRLRSICISAIKQSQRVWLPAIHVNLKPDDVLRQFPDHRYIIAHEKGNDNTPIRELTTGSKDILFIGPEGGFSPSEVDMIRTSGGVIVSLGDYRLRAETAAIAGLSQLLI
ncbi:MAG: RsmE family RNA methyltransferase [Bacteroidota bacterium]